MIKALWCVDCSRHKSVQITLTSQVNRSDHWLELDVYVFFSCLIIKIISSLKEKNLE